jgi:hypothetical protein
MYCRVAIIIDPLILQFFCTNREDKYDLSTRYTHEAGTLVLRVVILVSFYSLGADRTKGLPGKRKDAVDLYI